jgi:hypothetical protein
MTTVIALSRANGSALLPQIPVADPARRRHLRPARCGPGRAVAQPAIHSRPQRVHPGYAGRTCRPSAAVCASFSSLCARPRVGQTCAMDKAYDSDRVHAETEGRGAARSSRSRASKGSNSSCRRASAQAVSCRTSLVTLSGFATSTGAVAQSSARSRRLRRITGAPCEGTGEGSASRRPHDPRTTRARPSAQRTGRVGSLRSGPERHSCFAHTPIFCAISRTPNVFVGCSNTCLSESAAKPRFELVE